MQLHTRSATQMLALLEAGEVSAVELTRALIARVEAVDPKINALPVRRFELALAEAANADAARAAGAAGPLCGLPITVKENLDFEGLDSTMGLTARRGAPATQDAAAVAALREAGAVVIGKTNVPQFLLAQETENVIWGTTRNPWNLDRVPGGSSGGSAAAVAAGMSAFGLGTDIGGSVRVPCHFTGLFGIKPTVDRWSLRGSRGALPGQEMVRAMMGPITRTAADLQLAISVMDPVKMARLDPRVPPLPFGDPAAVDLTGLRIGWFDDDGYLTPAPAVGRAVREARDALVAAGATLVPYRPVDQGAVVALWIAAIGADGGRTFRRQLHGDALIPQIAFSHRLGRLPAAARKAAAAVMERTGQGRLARLLRASGEKTVEALWDLVAKRTELRMAEFDAWNAAELDAVICPPFATPAMPHRSTHDFVASMSYPFRYSYFDFPAGVAPVTRVTDVDVAARAEGGDRVVRKIAETAVGSEGLPVGVQIVGRPWQEATVLALMGAIEAATAGSALYPQTPVEPR